MEWTATYGKQYDSREAFEARQRNWWETELRIRRNANASFTMAHNAFSDWSDEERSAFLTLRPEDDDDSNSSWRDNQRNLSRDADSDDDEDVDFNLSVPKLGNGSCPSGYFEARRRCRRCPKECKECLSRRTCTSCSVEEMSLKNGKCECESGFFTGSGCEECDAGHYYYKRARMCLPCSNGCADCSQYHRCSACNSGWELWSGYCWCDTYNGGTIQADGSCTYEFECPDGQYDLGDQTCADCPSNCKACEDETGTCTACEHTYTLSSEDNQCVCPTGSHETAAGCVTCQASQFWDGSACQQCGDFCESCVDITGECATCKDTFEVHATDAAKCECPAEFYMTSDETCVPLEDCPAGEYQTGQGCAACGANCAECEDYTANCISCTDTTYTIQEETCACSSTQFDNGQGCEDHVICPDG